MTRFTITFDADLKAKGNSYPGTGDVTNIRDALEAGHIEPGAVIYVELSTGDAVRGSLIEMTAEEAV